MIRFRPIHLVVVGPLILCLSLPYIAEGRQATALVSTAVGGATLAYGLHTLRRTRFLAFSAVALVVLLGFAGGVILARALGMF